MVAKHEEHKNNGGQVKVIVPESPKSPQEFIDILLEILSDARRFELTGLAIAYTAKEFTHTEAVISSNGNFPELIGVIDEVKQRDHNEWNNAD